MRLVPGRGNGIGALPPEWQCSKPTGILSKFLIWKWFDRIRLSWEAVLGHAESCNFRIKIVDLVQQQELKYSKSDIRLTSVRKVA